MVAGAEGEIRNCPEARVSRSLTHFVAVAGIAGGHVDPSAKLLVDGPAATRQGGAMKKSATELMQEIISAAAIDSVLALKAGSKGMSNALLQTLNAIHANTTHADLPPELQAAIAANVRAAFTRLLKEGYAVTPSAPGSGPGPRGDQRKPQPSARPGQPPRPGGGRGKVDRTRPPGRGGKPGPRGGPPKR